MRVMMKMTMLDIFLTKLAVLLGSCWLIGLVATRWPFQVLLFLIQNKWWLLLAALIVAIIPMKKFSASCGEKVETKKKFVKKTKKGARK